MIKGLFNKWDLVTKISDIPTSSYPVHVMISTPGKTRTLSQNALLWKWNTQVSDWLQSKGEDYNDWTPDFVHDMHKHTFLGWYQKEYTDIKTGKSFKCHVLRSTTELEKGEFQDFMEKIYSYWSNKKLFLFVPELSEYSKNND